MQTRSHADATQPVRLTDSGTSPSMLGSWISAIHGIVPRSETVRENLGFMKLWLRRPASLGAVLPSSKSLGSAMAEAIDTPAPGAVVELGGGTGSITAALLESGVAPEDLVVIEREAALCRVLAARLPNVRIIQGDARRLKSLLREAGIGPVRAVVSGLPLLSLPGKTCIAIIAQALSVLPADGVFVQFTYGPASPVSRALASHFNIKGDRASWVLDNLPPASVWRYYRGTA